MRRAALDTSLALLLNTCAAAAALLVPGCAKEGELDGDGSDTSSNTPSDECQGSNDSDWYREDLELDTPGTVVSLTRRGEQVIALLGEGKLVPLGDIGDATSETLPATELRAWVELSNGDRLAVGAGGQILRSASGSLAWTVIDAGISEDLLDVVEIEGGAALAIASDRVLHSSDAGLTWTELGAGTWMGLRRVFRAAEQIWLIGAGGQVWASGDTLDGWEAVEIGTDEDLLDGSEMLGCSSCVAIISAHALYRLGASGWTSMPAPDGELFTAIAADYLVTDRAVHDFSPDSDGLSRSLELELQPIAVASNSDEVFVAGSGGELVRLTPNFGGCIGRPWMIDGRPTTAAVAGVAQADRWTRDGLFEHASVASFARFVNELLALAAPPALVQAAQAAILDELEHARLCFELAAREHGRVLLCGPLPLDSQSSARAGDPVALALAVFEEGCVGESVAAIEAGLAAAECEDADARRALERIAADERRHAALAWRTLRWLLDEFGAPVRAALRRRLATLDARGDEPRVRTIAEVIRPMSSALLDASAPEARC